MIIISSFYIILFYYDDHMMERNNYYIATTKSQELKISYLNALGSILMFVSEYSGVQCLLFGCSLGA